MPKSMPVDPDKLRRRAVAADPRSAMEGMLQLMKKWETNEALLAGLTGD